MKNPGGSVPSQRKSQDGHDRGIPGLEKRRDLGHPAPGLVLICWFSKSKEVASSPIFGHRARYLWLLSADA